MRILMASPRGFCAGVDRAIDIVEIALQRFGRPVYARFHARRPAHGYNRLSARPVPRASQIAHAGTQREDVMSRFGR